MKNTFGQSVSVTLFGESHGPAVGVVMDGLCPGMPVEEEVIRRQLSRRRPSSLLDTTRQEPDAYQILSGVFEGRTTGTPLCLIIPNQNTRSGDYQYGLARPSHADYTAYCKYHGFEDYRGGGHFSGRITAALVAAGALLMPSLERLGIRVGTHILRCHGVEDRPFAEGEALMEDMALLQTRDFPVLDPDSGARMSEEILAARSACDSVGGVTQTAVTGMVPGVGEPWFDSVEGLLTHALFSLGGIKGVDFGSGFSLAEMQGSGANDAFFMQDGRVTTKTNHNGGINGGITNGMPILFRCAVKPTPSISRPQDTVDFTSGQDATLTIQGRHDPAIIRRVCPVIDSVVTITLCDLLAQRFGTDVFMREKSEK